MIKTALTSAPIMRHFDPALRMAVHIGASQNAVGVVHLQWQSGESHPRPVAFMSRKLSWAQYRYDAQSVEALAARIALNTWYTILMGDSFEIYSDHGSLKYLLTQKAPSQRILSLCKFLADYDFQEIKYVPGPENVVRDFLSRLCDQTPSDLPIHKLATAIPNRQSSLQQ